MDAACFDLVNSEVWYGLGPLEDRLASDPTWLDGFLARWGLVVSGRRTKQELDALARLRSLLRRLIAAGLPPRGADLAELNAFLSASPVERQLVPSSDGYALTHSPLRPNWIWVLAEIAASYADLIAAGQLERIKTCANPQCRWAFYDDTKNRRRRWCDAAICGNRDKVRRFRERARAAN